MAQAVAIPASRQRLIAAKTETRPTATITARRIIASLGSTKMLLSSMRKVLRMVAVIHTRAKVHRPMRSRGLRRFLFSRDSEAPGVPGVSSVPTAASGRKDGSLLSKFLLVMILSKEKQVVRTVNATRRSHPRSPTIPMGSAKFEPPSKPTQLQQNQRTAVENTPLLLRTNVVRHVS